MTNFDPQRLTLKGGDLSRVNQQTGQTAWDDLRFSHSVDHHRVKPSELF